MMMARRMPNVEGRRSKVEGQMTKPRLVVARGIERRAFPSAVVEVGRRDGMVWREAFGRLTYADDAPATRDDTIYDLASLTKVMVTTPLAMQATDAGKLALDDRVAQYLPEWRGADREAVTIADLLEHASGLTAYLPFFRDHQGRAEFEQAICTLPLEYAPRTQSIYSDLGFILLAFILEDVNHVPFGRQFEEFRGDDATFRLKAETTESRGDDATFRLKAETTESRGDDATFRLKAE